MKNYTIRPATADDIGAIHHLYLTVSKEAGGLARTSEEITFNYIECFTTKASQSGLQYVIEAPSQGMIVGEIHCYKPGPRVFDHILSELTIAVHPDYQGQGLGKSLFKHLLDIVCNQRRDILRVELIARESNIKAISCYQKLGFQIEGKLLNRIKGRSILEADIPMAWMNENYEGLT